MTFLLIYIAAANAAAFAVYGADKRRAKLGKRRISEAVLLTYALAGGSAGAWFGMRVWHHKTRHLKFRYGVPAIMVLQAAAAVYLLTLIYR